MTLDAYIATLPEDRRQAIIAETNRKLAEVRVINGLRGAFARSVDFILGTFVMTVSSLLIYRNEYDWFDPVAFIASIYMVGHGIYLALGAKD